MRHRLYETQQKETQDFNKIFFFRKRKAVDSIENKVTLPYETFLADNHTPKI